MVIHQFWRGDPVAKASDGLNHELCLAKTEGLAVNAYDLASNVAPALNAAYEYALCAPGIANVGRHLSSLEEGDHARHFACRDILRVTDPLKPRIARFDKSSRLPFLEMPFTMTCPVAIDYRSLMDIRAAASLLTRRAYAQCDEGDWRGAFETLMIPARVACQFSKTEGVMCLHARVQIAQSCLICAEHILGRYGRSAECRSDARRLISALGPDPNLRQSYREALPNFLCSATGADSEGCVYSKRTPAQLPKRQSAALVLGVDAIREYWKLLPVQPCAYPSLLKRVHKMDKQLWTKDSSHFLTSSYLCSPSGYIVQAQFFVARRRLVAAEADILESMQNAGRAPDRWSFHGSQGQDPFTGGPFRYCRTQDGFRIFSRGREGFDKSDQLVKGASNTLIYDPALVLQYPRPVALDARTKRPVEAVLAWDTMSVKVFK